MFLGLSLYIRPYDLLTTFGHAMCMVGVCAFDISYLTRPYVTPEMSECRIRVCTLRYTHMIMIRTPYSTLEDGVRPWLHHDTHFFNCHRSILPDSRVSVQFSVHDMSHASMCLCTCRPTPSCMSPSPRLTLYSPIPNLRPFYVSSQHIAAW